MVRAYLCCYSDLSQIRPSSSLPITVACTLSFVVEARTSRTVQNHRALGQVDAMGQLPLLMGRPGLLVDATRTTRQCRKGSEPSN